VQHENAVQDDMMKLIRSGFQKSSMISDVLFALVTSLVSGCLGALALILLVLALAGNNF
jgi:hypothetical protein